VTSGGNDFSDFTKNQLTKLCFVLTVDKKITRNVKGGIAHCPLKYATAGDWAAGCGAKGVLYYSAEGSPGGPGAIPLIAWQLLTYLFLW